MDFGTAALMAAGCVMARQCHLNTCPVGVAAQREDLRAKFPGKPEHVVNFFKFVAQETREYMAAMGVRQLKHLIGRSELLRVKENAHYPKTRDIDLSALFYQFEKERKQSASLRGRQKRPPGRLAD